MAKVNYLLKEETYAQHLLHLHMSNTREVYDLVTTIPHCIYDKRGAFYFELFFSSSTFFKISRQVHLLATKAEGYTSDMRMSSEDRNNAVASWIYNDMVDYISFKKNDEN